jgi:hypothetical protein
MPKDAANMPASGRHTQKARSKVVPRRAKL